MIDVCCENDTKHYENNVQLNTKFLNITASGIYTAVNTGRYVVNLNETYIHTSNVSFACHEDSSMWNN